MRVKYAGALLEDVNAPSVSEKRYEEAFARYLLRPGINDRELRDITVGQQTITWTTGPQGGFTIPIKYEAQTREAMAAFDPLLDPDVTDFSMENSLTLQPSVIQGFDLSTVQASLVSEITQQTAQSFPAVAGGVLRANLIYKASFAASYEAEIDIPNFLSKLARAVGIAFARRIGSDCINGNATTQPQGILTALPTPVYSTGSGKITLNDITAIYFSVNKAYRSMPKCAWLVNDGTYHRIRKATDNSGRPLLSVRENGEVLMGKRIFVCPSIPGNVNGSPISSSTIVFGDLDHYRIRISRPMLTRETQQSLSDITRGQALWVGRVRADAQLFDPSNGSAPPLVTATVTA
jgi:HK97 family phage major capsid protein